jgi:hypothetical protein
MFGECILYTVLIAFVVTGSLWARRNLVLPAFFRFSSPGDRAFVVATGLLALLSIGSEIFLWVRTGKTQIWSVSPNEVWGIYCLCAFSIRAIHLWRKRRNGSAKAGRGR